MKTTRGFTLVEVLISLGILGIIITVLFQTIGSTTGLSNTTNSSNDLIREGQIAQQLLNARFKEACYVYPPSNTLTLAASGFTTQNGAGNTWTVNTHPIVAVILPPEPSDTRYRFLAYYAIPRSQYVNSAATSSNPGADVNNDSSVWMLMEYRRLINVSNSVTFPSRFCADLASNSNFVITGGNAQLLTDYISPVATSTELFSVGGTTTNGSAAFVEYNLRLQKTTRGDGVNNTVSVGGGASGTTLTAKVYPVNLGL